MIRCVNLDWLEVYCLESITHPPTQTLLAERFEVIARNYGTPCYEQVLTLTRKGEKFAFLEVRRVPRKNSEGGTFLPPNATHIRLTNRTCYEVNPIGMLIDFLAAYNYTFCDIKRVDIAIDFNTFDNGLLPAAFLQQFFAEKFFKINQANIAAHGVDGWNGRYFNSVKWGSERSNITTKFYNKSLELRNGKEKLYIREAWRQAGLNIARDIWRVEFSIKGGRKGFQNTASQEFYKMKLSTFNNREKLLWTFETLAKKYFHFKVKGSNARKDRCEDVTTFHFLGVDKPYILMQQTKQKDPTRTDKVLYRRLIQIAEDCDNDISLRNAAYLVAEDLLLHIPDFCG